VNYATIDLIMLGSGTYNQMVLMVLMVVGPSISL